MIIDLRSDTFTKPSEAMRKAMASAEVGDDVFGEDPTVNRLQQKVASMLGKEAGLFVASGTMGNQVAINAHTQPGDEVILFSYVLCRALGVSSHLPRSRQPSGPQTSIFLPPV